MKLVIVESPTKARTLSKFLGSDYQIEATMGHLRDLPQSKLGIEIVEQTAEEAEPSFVQPAPSASGPFSQRDNIQDNLKSRVKGALEKGDARLLKNYNFLPQYELVEKKKETIDKLVNEAQKADNIILATDPDREGEAIAWHVSQILKSTRGDMGITRTTRRKAHDTRGTLNSRATLQRIVFHEITESAINEALASPRTLDMNLVDAQQARRILDRLVGYKLSPLLWRKIRRGLSAGRVQSVVVRLIVEREREIAKFKPEEFWRIFVDLQKDSQIVTFELVKLNGEKIGEQQTFNLFDGDYTISKTKIKTQTEAQQIIDQLQDKQFVVTNVATSGFQRTPGPAFTTSSLQQEANRRFGFTSKRTMNIAQKLYEEGKITYHRTDSVVLSNQFMGQVQQYIKQNYGQDYTIPYFRKYTTKQKLAQEAHEAIRPTNVGDKGPAFAEATAGKKGLGVSDEKRLYELIWKRAVATQMKEASLEKTTVLVNCNNAEFIAEGVKIVFNGFLILYKENSDDKILPPFTVGEKLTLLAFSPTQKFTEPPPRYTEATLIKALEEKGIGRPSTYAPIISTIQERQYVEKVTDPSTGSGRRGRFQPTVLGITVNDFLVENFAEIVEVNFTAKMEDELDSIARGENQWVLVISQFYSPFEQILIKVADVARVKIPVEETDEKCEKCGAPLVIRIGRFGKFLACSKFPDCKFTKSFVNKTGLTCPKCGGEIVIKKTKKRRNFFGCSHYPKCDFAAWRKEEITKQSNDNK